MLSWVQVSTQNLVGEVFLLLVRSCWYLNNAGAIKTIYLHSHQGCLERVETIVQDRDCLDPNRTSDTNARDQVEKYSTSWRRDWYYSDVDRAFHCTIKKPSSLSLERFGKGTRVWRVERQRATPCAVIVTTSMLSSTQSLPFTMAALKNFRNQYDQGCGHGDWRCRGHVQKNFKVTRMSTNLIRRHGNTITCQK